MICKVKGDLSGGRKLDIFVLPECSDEKKSAVQISLYEKQ